MLISTPFKTVECINCTDPMEGIKVLISQIDATIAKKTIQYTDNIRYDLGISVDTFLVSGLMRYRSILVKKLHCNTCVQDLNTDTIISKIQRILYK